MSRFGDTVLLLEAMKPIPVTIVLLALLHGALCSLGQKPNVILINADDLGYGDLSCYGATKVKTPHIERLAKEGMLFEKCYVSSFEIFKLNMHWLHVTFYAICNF